MISLIHKTLRRGPNWVIRCNWAALDPLNNPEFGGTLKIKDEIANWLDCNDPNWYYRETMSPPPIYHKLFKDVYWYSSDIKYYCDIYLSKEIITAFKLVWGNSQC